VGIEANVGLGSEVDESTIRADAMVVVGAAEGSEKKSGLETKVLEESMEFERLRAMETVGTMEAEVVTAEAMETVGTMEAEVVTAEA